MKPKNSNSLSGIERDEKINGMKSKQLFVLNEWNEAAVAQSKLMELNERMESNWTTWNWLEWLNLMEWRPMLLSSYYSSNWIWWVDESNWPQIERIMKNEWLFSFVDCFAVFGLPSGPPATSRCSHSINWMDSRLLVIGWHSHSRQAKTASLPLITN